MNFTNRGGKSRETLELETGEYNAIIQELEDELAASALMLAGLKWQKEHLNKEHQRLREKIQEQEIKEETKKWRENQNE